MREKIIKRFILTAMILCIAGSFALPQASSAKTIKPAKVRSVTVSKITYNSITLKWDKAKKAKKYEIYRSLKKKSGYQLIAKISKRHYTDKNLETGTKYWYQIRGVSKDGKHGARSSRVSAIPSLERPTLKAETSAENVTLSISKPTDGADGYIFYREGVELASGVTSFVDADTVAGEEHMYTAAAYRMVGDRKVLSDLSESVTAAKEPPTAKLVDAIKVRDPLFTGNSYGLSGQIVANVLIKKVEVGIRSKASGQWDWVESAYYHKTYKKKDADTTFDIGKADSSIKFGTLDPGTYRYTIKVTFYGNIEQRLRYQKFTVKDFDLDSTKASKGAKAAVKWARKIANDDSFAYGTGHTAHHGGCYFCGTNTGPKMYKKGHNSKYEKTYCCNPFIFAAYAHGAKDPQILAACKKGKCGGMEPSDWTMYGCFVTVGKCKNVPYSKLLPGDVIISNKNVNGHYHHVIMECGNNQYVEAGWEGWGASTIGVRSGSEKNYNKHYRKYKGCYVMRYVGD